MRVREYGIRGPLVIVLHGGPAAVGDVAPVAARLGESFRALEPWQRGSGKAPLTVARHIEDLDNLVSAQGHDSRPALVGHSWGAMLALCYAAAHPNKVGPIVLVGCGTFDAVARQRMKAILSARTTRRLQERLDRIAASVTDPADRHIQRYKLTRNLSVYEQAQPWPEKDEWEPFDQQAHKETWDDILRLQSDGTYPQAFKVIKSPVLMLHGSYDPHPGQLIYDTLQPFITQLQYQELDRCGHSPWLERYARDRFFSTLEEWLSRTGPRSARS